MSEHTVTIEFEDGCRSYTFTCNAGPKSLCHARYTCDCETWYDQSIRNGVPAHRPDPFDEGLWHAGVFDADECSHKPWFDEADDAPLDGEVTFSVNPVWQGDYETFDIATTTDAEAKLAAVEFTLDGWADGQIDAIQAYVALRTILDGEVES